MQTLVEQLRNVTLSIDDDIMREAADRIEELEAALRRVVADVNEYERINHLYPNPGRTECWDSVAHAKRVLENR